MDKDKTEITTYRPTVSLNYMQQLSISAAESGMYKKFGNKHAAFMVLQFGFDLGLSPSAALSSIHFYEGKPTMSGNLMWAIVKNHPNWKKSKVLRRDDKGCQIEWNEDGIVVGTSEFDEGDAKRAGLLSKNASIYLKYPRAMYFNRAISEGFKVYCPHLGNGYTLYTPDELGQAINEDGSIANVQDASFCILNSASPPLPKPQDLKALLSKAGMSEDEVCKALGLLPHELSTLTPDEMKRLNELVERKLELQRAALSKAS